MPDCSRILYISSQMLCTFSSYAQKHACMSKSIATAHTYVYTNWVCLYTCWHFKILMHQDHSCYSYHICVTLVHHLICGWFLLSAHVCMFVYAVVCSYICMYVHSYVMYTYTIHCSSFMVEKFYEWVRYVLIICLKPFVVRWSQLNFWNVFVSVYLRIVIICSICTC